MTNLVPTEDIERIVGARRDATMHQARAVSAEQTVYILHSQECLDRGRDLRQCPFSLALDNGIRTDEWVEDEPVVVIIEGAFEDTRLVPILGGKTGPMNSGKWRDCDPPQETAGSDA